MFGISSGQKKENDDTLWWNEGAQARERLAKKMWEMKKVDRNTERLGKEGGGQRLNSELVL